MSHEDEFKLDRRARRKENRRFPIHGLSLQHILNAERKRAMKAAAKKHTMKACWCEHEKHRWNGAVLKCDNCIKESRP